MTLEDLIARESIRDTLAIVSQAGDALDFDRYAGSFTPDGVLTFREHVNEGRDEIRAWTERNGAARTARGVTFVRHNVTSTVIRLVSPTRAEVRSYYFVYGHGGPDHFGDYQDVFVLHEGRWLIRERVVGLDWVSDASRHAGNTERKA